MKKLSLLFVVCMVSMLALAQANSPSPDESSGGGIVSHRQGLSQDLASDDAPAPGDVSLNPPSWNFGVIAVDFAYDKVFTLTNNRSNPITITSISASPDPFSVVSTTCLSSLPAGGYCYITVQAYAHQVGQGLIMGTLEVACTGAPGCPFTAPLTATRVHDVVLTPNGCNFGDVYLGDSGYCTVALKNNDPVPLAISSIYVGGPPFSQTNNCAPSVLALGTCTINVKFTPTYVGQASSNLTVNDNSPEGTPAPAPLVGYGLYCNPKYCPPPSD